MWTSGHRLRIKDLFNSDQILNVLKTTQERDLDGLDRQKVEVTLDYAMPRFMQSFKSTSAYTV